MKSRRLAIDIAKGVFQGVLSDSRSQVVWSRRWRRGQLMPAIARLDPCLIVMEACSTSHYWARAFRQHGHEVMLLPAHHVTPYRQGQKNDHADALAILEASYRPLLKPVPVKSERQQYLQSVYKVRRRLIERRTALSNQMRGLLGEFGYVFPSGLGVLRRELPRCLEQLEVDLAWLMGKQYEELCVLDQRIEEMTRHIEQRVKADECCVRLMKLPGIGPITACLLRAHCCPEGYRNGRSYSASLGLVPRQHSSGDQVRLYGMTRTGNKELRMLLIHGGRSVVRRMAANDDEISRFARSVCERRGKNKAAVAVANKLARQAWAELRQAA